MVLPQVIAESVMGDIESGQSEAEDRAGLATCLVLLLHDMKTCWLKLFGSFSSFKGGRWMANSNKTVGWSTAPCRAIKIIAAAGRTNCRAGNDRQGWKWHTRVSVGLLSGCHVVPARQSSLKVCELPGADFCEEDGASLMKCSPTTLLSHIRPIPIQSITYLVHG